MPSRINDTVFREPSGRRNPTTLAHFAGAVLFASQYVYYGVIGGESLGWLLVMTTGFGLSGIAESLPANRQRAAGTLRLAAIFVFVSLVIALFLAPEAIVG